MDGRRLRDIYGEKDKEQPGFVKLCLLRLGQSGNSSSSSCSSSSFRKSKLAFWLVIKPKEKLPLSSSQYRYRISQGQVQTGSNQDQIKAPVISRAKPLLLHLSQRGDSLCVFDLD